MSLFRYSREETCPITVCTVNGGFDRWLLSFIHDVSFFWLKKQNKTPVQTSQVLKCKNLTQSLKTSSDPDLPVWTLRVLPVSVGGPSRCSHSPQTCNKQKWTTEPPRMWMWAETVLCLHVFALWWCTLPQLLVVMRSSLQRMSSSIKWMKSRYRAT